MQIVEKSWAKLRALWAQKADSKQFDLVIDDLKRDLAQVRAKGKRVYKED